VLTLRQRACVLTVLLAVCWRVQPAQGVKGGGRQWLAMRGISRVCRAAAPPGSSGKSDEFGPRRALGSVDIDGRGVQHELSSFGPFVFVEDALLPRGNMPPFGKHPHAGLLSITLLLRGDYVKPWDNIRGHSATLRPRGMYVVNSGSGIVHSEDNVEHNAHDTGSATHAIFIWLDPGIMRADYPDIVASARVFLPTEIPVVEEQGAMTIRVLLGAYRGGNVARTSPFGHLASDVQLIEVELRPAACSTQHVIHIPNHHTLAFLFIPRFGGSGELPPPMSYPSSSPPVDPTHSSAPPIFCCAHPLNVCVCVCRNLRSGQSEGA
jgi:redox-sensitive bicupin YhaK (pirin superfamily)